MPAEPGSLVGQQYKVSECFVYHINTEGKIDLMRQYLDAGSVWRPAQIGHALFFSFSNWPAL